MCANWQDKLETMERLGREIDVENKIYSLSFKIYAFIKKIAQWFTVRFQKQPSTQGIKKVINSKLQVK